MELTPNILKTIKPCPFCGGKNLSYGDYYDYDGAESEAMSIECEDCGIFGPSAGSYSWGRGTEITLKNGKEYSYWDDTGVYNRERNKQRNKAEKDMLPEAIRLWNGIR